MDDPAMNIAPDEYVSSDPLPEPKQRKEYKLLGITDESLSPDKSPRPLPFRDFFGAIAIADLSPSQIEALLSKSHNPIHTYSHCRPKGKYKIIHSFEKYIVKQINKMPEQDVGRVVKIETWGNPKNGTNTVVGICLNKYKDPNRKQFSIRYSTKMPQLIKKRKEIVKELVIQLKTSFNQQGG